MADVFLLVFLLFLLRLRFLLLDLLFFFFLFFLLFLCFFWGEVLETSIIEVDNLKYSPCFYLSWQSIFQLPWTIFQIGVAVANGGGYGCDAVQLRPAATVARAEDSGLSAIFRSR